MPNEGEKVQHTRALPEKWDCTLPDVLLAPSLAMQELGSCGLSTTLFFDAQDRLVRRMWEADTCQLSRTVSRRFTLSLDHTAKIGSWPIPRPN